MTAVRHKDDEIEQGKGREEKTPNIHPLLPKLRKISKKSGGRGKKKRRENKGGEKGYRVPEAAGLSQLGEKRETITRKKQGS